MKRLIALSFLLVALTAFTLNAKPVTPEKALEVASMIIGNGDGASRDLQIVWTGSSDRKADENAPFYVVASPGGFVIIAGDDNVRPVLAISENGRFNSVDMPCNVKWWFEQMANYVRSVSVQSDVVRRQWEAYTVTKDPLKGIVTDKVECLTPEWDQGNIDMITFGRLVFNARTPLKNGEHTLTGCVATAMAEILTYHSGIFDNMPDHGVGTVGGYQPEREGAVAPEEYDLGTVYDWENLRTLTGTDAIRAAIEAGKEELLDNLAQLMADCGAMVGASYGIDGTGAYTGLVATRLAQYMGYNKRARALESGTYFHVDWEQMLMEELDKRPLIYTGNGHAFILDGYGRYDGDPVFHVNFGWGGSANGYYYLLDMSDGYNGNFYEESGTALFNLYPDPDSTPAPATLWLLIWMKPDYHSVHGPDVIPLGENFRVVIKGIGGVTAAYRGTIRVNLADKNGEPKLVGIGSTKQEFLPLNGYTEVFIKCFIPADTPVELGDKLVFEASTDETETEFYPINFPQNGSIVGEIPMIPVNFVYQEPNYHVGDAFRFKLINNVDIYEGTEWEVLSPSGEKTVYPHTDGGFRLKETGEYLIQAHVRPEAGDAVTETIMTKILVQ